MYSALVAPCRHKMRRHARMRVARSLRCCAVAQRPPASAWPATCLPRPRRPPQRCPCHAHAMACREAQRVRMRCASSPFIFARRMRAQQPVCARRHKPPRKSVRVSAPHTASAAHARVLQEVLQTRDVMLPSAGGVYAMRRCVRDVASAQACQLLRRCVCMFVNRLAFMMRVTLSLLAMMPLCASRYFAVVIYA